MTQKLMPLSFSRLSCFEQCPAKFDYLYNSKTVKDQDNEHTLYGTRVHTGLELYGRMMGGDANAEAELALAGGEQDWGPHRGMVEKIIARPGDKYFEYQMAIDAAKQPCEWFAKEVWLRGIADVLIIDGDSAWCGDWKTGKVKDNPTQMQVFALMVFAHFPLVQRVKASFIWLNHNEISTTEYTRSMVPALWGALGPRFAAVQDAVDLGVFKAKPTGLCGWCPAKQICPQARRR